VSGNSAERAEAVLCLFEVSLPVAGDWKARSWRSLLVLPNIVLSCSRFLFFTGKTIVPDHNENIRREVIAADI
jgi:hypothetical protein